ncbi:hypothetical protein [Aeromonas cavernicola]|uniref:hypothetical protein n=1 Tax=Aeromonas cavernicola TaxID=1006623 RepID=UPI0012FE5FAB|nr:hypothetical protein [Aeromonas cavernicola]
MMHYNNKVFFLCLMLFSNISYGAESLYFHCLTKKGDVKLSVNNGKLTYMIKSDSSVFSYNSKGDKFGGFSHNLYSRYQTEYTRVNFMNGDYSYSLFSDYEDNKKNAGVMVTYNKKEYIYLCSKVFINKLNMLAPLLRCNKDDALGCA